MTLALAGALPLIDAPSARAHIVPVSDMIRGINMTQAQCGALPSTVWVPAMGRNFCFRYYLATAGGEGSRPVVYFPGDKLGRFNVHTWEFAPQPPDVKDIDTDDLQKNADGLSKQMKTTAIYFGRVGIDGSSGDHRVRHSVLELNATNVAMEAIKLRHRFEGFHVVGQSGGATLIGGLLTLRTDIGCAAIGAGRLAILKPAPRFADPARNYFAAADNVALIARQSSARIMVVTDPADKKVPALWQTTFVQMMQQAGRPVEQYFVQATDENRHGITPYARFVTSGCLLGAPAADLTQRLAQFVERRLAAARDQIQNSGPSAPAGPPSAGPAPIQSVSR